MMYAEQPSVFTPFSTSVLIFLVQTTLLVAYAFALQEDIPELNSALLAYWIAAILLQFLLLTNAKGMGE